MPPEADQNKDQATPPATPPQDAPAPPSLDDVLKELEKERAEKKAMAEKLSSFEKEKADLENKALEQKGEYKTLLEKEREDRAKEKLEAAKRFQGMLGIQVRSGLEKAGAEDVDNLMKLVGGFESKVKFDKDTMLVDSQSLSSLIDEVKKSHSRYFLKEMPPVKDGVPSNNQPKTKEEEYHAELDACKTQLELEKVMKKYGRI